MPEGLAALGLSIEALADHHDRAAFSCGIPEFDSYLQKRAGQDRRRKIAAPFVACKAGSAGIAGYYTLSALSVHLTELPRAITKRLPRYPEIPATLIGRLAVAREWRGQGVGKLLLMDALHRSLCHADEIAAHAVVVDATDNNARGFYEAFGFQPFPDQPRRLFLPMQTVSNLFDN